MKKIVAIAATAALLASAGTYAFAQGPGPGAPGPGQERGRTEGRGLSQDEANRLLDARIAAIKAGLKLSADQEKLWAPVENTIRTNAAERFKRMEERRSQRDERRSMDLMQRLETRSAMLTASAQRATALTTALRPLWDTFSEDQKRIAPRLMRSVAGGMDWRERGDRRGGHRMGMMHHHRGMGPAGMGPGGMGPGGMGPGGQQAPAEQPKQP